MYIYIDIYVSMFIYICIYIYFLPDPGLNKPNKIQLSSVELRPKIPSLVSL